MRIQKFPSSSVEFEQRNFEFNNSSKAMRGSSNSLSSREDSSKLPVQKQSKDEQLNFHYIGEEDEENDEKESLSFMLDEDEDMEVMSVNDQAQSLNELGSTSSSRNSFSSAKSNHELTLSRDSMPLKKQRERDLRDSISSNQSIGGKSGNSSHESLKSSPRYVEKQGSTRPARIAEYIKRFRTAPPTKRTERKGLDDLDNLGKLDTNIILDEILPSRKKKASNFKQGDNSIKESIDSIDAIDFDIKEISRMALESTEVKNLDSIISNSVSTEKSNILIDSGDDHLDEMFRQSVLSRLQSIGLHESYLNPNSYEIIGDEKNDVFNKVEELMKERNLVEQMLIRDNMLTKQGMENKPLTSSIAGLSEMPVTQSLESLDELPFESKQIQFIDEEEIETKLGLEKSSCSISSYKENSSNLQEDFLVTIDINDDDNELFMNDYICQNLKLKIDQLRQQLSEVERKYSLLE
ncbi:predicted protein [Naegleria gruberi]|uniref:Predicted protein n=1 Tax=Naegleria gruberi TaxID=5762 RepID=D2VK80_NAEGR|nr:uncharacterized protein NAEGRDRAFT_50234 [Naegleria gruberi]EFC42902.1 predicted protein [Naegleria gruberi]|eukprot:XP_002675646.1 predicted protein [Naegleria gruberi strain NEG-M]